MFDIKIYKNKIINLIIYILFFLTALDFHNMHNYFIFLAMIMYCLFCSKIYFTGLYAIYIGLGLLIGFYNNEARLFSIIRPFSYFFCFFIGYNLIKNIRYNILNDKEIQRQVLIIRTCIVWAAGTFLHYVLNFIYNLNNPVGRNTIDIWMGSVSSATRQASLASLAIAVSVYFFIQKKTIYTISAFAISAIILMYNFVLAGRTILVMVALVFSGGLLYFLIYSKSNKRRLRILVILAIIIFICAFIFLNNYGGIKDKILSSNLLKRFTGEYAIGALEDGRTSLKLIHINNFLALSHPFGGAYSRSLAGNYAHDLLLDSYDEYGIIGFILLLIILSSSIFHLYNLFFNYKSCVDFKVLIFCLYFVVFLEFIVEPILLGVDWLFAFYAYLNGCILALTERKRNEKNIMAL